MKVSLHYKHSWPQRWVLSAAALMCREPEGPPGWWMQAAACVLWRRSGLGILKEHLARCRAEALGTSPASFSVRSYHSSPFYAGHCRWVTPRFFWPPWFSKPEKEGGNWQQLLIAESFSAIFMPSIVVLEDNQIIFEALSDSSQKNAFLCHWIANWVICV